MTRYQVKVHVPIAYDQDVIGELLGDPVMPVRTASAAWRR